jgi:Family of unknown function (DUF5340)
MSPIPLPSHIHYELLLQLLERQTLPTIPKNHHHQTQELISTLRKALSQQKQLETELERTNHPIEHHWSLNNNP